jgi:hypothetical protein
MGRMTLKNLNPVRSFSLKPGCAASKPCMSETDHAEEPAERNADYCYFFNAACRTKGVPNGIGPRPLIFSPFFHSLH